MATQKDYGTIVWNGRIVKLTAAPECSSRLLPSNPSTPNEGEYDFEVVAPGHYIDGEEEDVEVSWIFENIENQDLDMYDYEDVYSVTLI